MPRLLWCITVAVIAKKVKMKRMKVCPSVIRYLSGGTGSGYARWNASHIHWIYFTCPSGEELLKKLLERRRPFKDNF